MKITLQTTVPLLLLVILCASCVRDAAEPTDLVTNRTQDGSKAQAPEDASPPVIPREAAIEIAREAIKGKVAILEEWPLRVDIVGPQTGTFYYVVRFPIALRPDFNLPDYSEPIIVSPRTGKIVEQVVRERMFSKEKATAIAKEAVKGKVKIPEGNPVRVEVVGEYYVVTFPTNLPRGIRGGGLSRENNHPCRNGRNREHCGESVITNVKHNKREMSASFNTESQACASDSVALAASWKDCGKKFFHAASMGHPLTRIFHGGFEQRAVKPVK